MANFQLESTGEERERKTKRTPCRNATTLYRFNWEDTTATFSRA